MVHIGMGSAVTPEKSVDAESEGSRRLAILLVEDEVLIRMDVAYSLRAEGWHVVEAGTAADALAALARSTFDVLLTDVHMPGAQSGLDLIRLARSSHPDLKIAVMSGGHMPSGDVSPNYHAFYTKPVFDIVSRIRKLIEAEGL